MGWQNNEKLFGVVMEYTEIATNKKIEHSTEKEQKPIHSIAAAQPIDMNKVACIILGGGQGTRLFPLTLNSCKPAISFGGRYRLIDVPVSNSINAQIQKIFVITQFLSSTLHRHVIKSYRLASFATGFIEILSAEQKPERSAWYQGTADAVRQNLEYFADTHADYFLILSGDQLYHMDFQKMLHYAMTKDVDLVVATLPVEEKDAKRMGIMKINEDNHIVDFHEKPQTKEELEKLKTAPSLLEKMGLSTTNGRQFLGSMGIYLFKRKALFDLLKYDPREDFGKHLIPTKVKQGSIACFPHNDYWEDIGTIESFYQANMALTLPKPPFDCHNEGSPIFTHREHLPGPKVHNAHINNSIICEGAILDSAQVTNSIIGKRAKIKRGSVIKDSYIMGNDFYHSPESPHEELFIGEDCFLYSCIIDKNVHIGNRVQLVNANKLQTYDSPNAYIRDGIIVIPRGARLPDDFIL
jgi:glucose-1-phosphate adenylyltransferase